MKNLNELIPYLQSLLDKKVHVEIHKHYVPIDLLSDNPDIRVSYYEIIKIIIKDNE